MSSQQDQSISKRERRWGGRRIGQAAPCLHAGLLIAPMQTRGPTLPSPVILVPETPEWMPWLLGFACFVLACALMMSIVLRRQVRQRRDELWENNLRLEAEIAERRRIEEILRASQMRISLQNRVLIRLARSDALSRGDLQAAMREITEAASHTLDVERVSVWLFDQGRTRIECADLYERSESRHSSGAVILAEEYPAYFTALEGDRAIMAHDAHTDPRTREFSPHYLSPLGITSMLDAPVRRGGELLGVICHEHVGPARRWSSEDEYFAGSLADCLALAIESHERREAEFALRESEERNRAVIENALDAVITTDESGIITGWNAQAELNFGRPREEVLGRSIHSLVVPPEFREACQGGFMRYLVTGERNSLIRRTELTALHGEGHSFPAELSVSAARLGDSVIFSAFVRDITERKAARENEERLVVLQRELELARSIQTSILPRTFPQRPDLEIYAEMIPAQDVAGDFYDFFPLDEHRMALVIGDVSGKGVPAAIFMAVCRTLVRAAAITGVPPNESLRNTNRLLCAEKHSGFFVTLFYGILDTRTGTVDYCSAGHLSPYVVSSHGVRPLPGTESMVLGVLDTAEFKCGSTTLECGETIFLYTDGVTEAMDAEQRQYREERLEDLLRDCDGVQLPDLVRRTVEDVQSFANGVPQHDDITVLAARYCKAVV